MAFNHENLEVYQRALAFSAKAADWTSSWDRKHAVGEQLLRAAESTPENTAMASAAYSAMKQRSLDFAIGSTLECAACLDLARVKELLDAKAVYTEKEELSQILRMLVGLRKSWAGNRRVVREDHSEYSVVGAGVDKARDKDWGGNPLFHHETLDIYRTALEAAVAYCSSEAVSQLPNPVFRRLDELLTSMVLNIAEGNGRFSRAEQGRFLRTVHEAAIKLAARLDLCVARDLLPTAEVGEWKSRLERVSHMAVALSQRKT